MWCMEQRDLLVAVSSSEKLVKYEISSVDI